MPGIYLRRICVAHSGKELTRDAYRYEEPIYARQPITDDVYYEYALIHEPLNDLGEVGQKEAEIEAREDHDRRALDP